MPKMPSDLSSAAGPLTSLFPGRASRARGSLSPAQRLAFDRDGFLAGIDVLDAAQLAAVRDAVDAIAGDIERYRPRLYEVERAFTERPGEVVCHFLGGWRVQPALHDLVFHPAATVPAADLLGVRALRFWHDQVFVKPPRHPGAVPWHQDFAYWTRTQPSCHITVNVMLDDADEQNGCLWFVPGSHRLGLLPRLPFDVPVEAIRRHLPADFEWRPVAAPLRAGQATIHHSHTLHGSYPNQSDRWRRAIVLNYMGAHVRSGDELPLLAGLPPIPVGQVVQGRHFPIVLAD